MSGHGPLPQPENRPDNTPAWLAANAALFVVAAPFAVAYWASKGIGAIKHDIRAMRPSSGPFRDFRRLKFEQERQAKTGMPASSEVWLPMRLDNDRYNASQGQVAQMPSLGAPSSAFTPSRPYSPSAPASDFRRQMAPRGASEVVLGRIATIPVQLNVLFAEREVAKQSGARWDKDQKVWYAPEGADLSKLARWLPRHIRVEASLDPEVARTPAQGATKPVAAQTAFRIEEGKMEAPAVHEMVLVGALDSSEEDLPPLDESDDMPQF